MIARLTPEAEADLAEARHWYRQRGVQAADGFMRAATAALELIEQYPAAQPVLYRTVRRVLISRYPYAML